MGNRPQLKNQKNLKEPVSILEHLKARKIPTQNIFYMLSYILNATVPSVVKNIAPENFENIYEFYAAILIRYVDHLIKEGLCREYMGICEDIPTVRGKIYIPGTIKDEFACKRLVTCEYDELSENILVNQIIKTTMESLCQCKEINSKLRKLISKNLWRFSGIDVIDKSLIPWSKINRNQNNKRYQFLLNLCWLILKNMILITNRGEKRRLMIIDAILQPHDFYEEFIRAYYRRKYREFFVKNRWFGWSLDDECDEYLPRMQFDIMLTDGDKLLIIDAKYKYDDNILHSGRKSKKLKLDSDNLYQIFTYVKNWQTELSKLNDENSEIFGRKNTKFKPGKHVVAGMLLYAKVEGQEDLNKTYKICGNEIYVRTLDLSKEKFTDIESQLNEISNDFFEKNISITPIKAV